ncbi:isoprenoid synthase domain-containing protein [Fomitopsis serialis]|uniref:isoprenoid synthase domain-containing protein n=1 Tax=Fomitopsis serialis TaxID=139415 RepID=UPI0020088F49|nr:isoprenoid synthase domain-containing protein [Neoantrodia serialis]KAH9936315.1 isoprenoid synthase domain-containing protein [Neoantrodia serialis]
MLRPTARRQSQLTCLMALPRGGARAVLRRFMATNAEKGGIQDTAAYCSDVVRKRDYESFLISHFWPRELREHFIALRAFYVELASVQEAVSNITLGKMRMQFWRDAVKDIADGRPPRHPTALALVRACQAANLQTYHLKRIIDARDAELDTPTHMSLDSLTSHAEATSSTFLYLQLSLLSLSASSSLSHAASHLGVAQGITTLLRALPYHASQGRMMIPAEITARHGVSQEEVFRKGGQASGIEDAVFEFATVPTRLYLERLEAANFDVFDPSLQVRGWQLPWRIWRSYYYKGQF